MIRIGLGHDVHALVPGRDCILGGVQIPFEKGPLGHSDADVLLHAVMDALLGALALGDIGSHFPDTDEAFRGASSQELTRRVMALVRERGYLVGNLDCCIQCERPKIAPYRERMRESVARLLDVSREMVSIKAGTNEGFDAVGAGEAIVCQAVVLLQKNS